MTHSFARRRASDLKSAREAVDRAKRTEALQRGKDLDISDHLVLQAQVTLDRSATVGQVDVLLDSAEDAAVLTDALERAIQLGITGERVDRAKARLRAMTGLNDTLIELRSAVKRSEEHTSELQSLMRISYAVFC